MSKPVPRSRLNITYRTRIEGEPKKVKLPMRFLVLGKLTTRNERLLSERPMHSLLPGMRLDSFMQEMKVSSPIPDGLAMTLRGQLQGSVSGVYKKPPEPTDTTATVVLSGRVQATGRGKDNGLGDFAGEIALEGEHDFTLEDGQIKLTEGGEKVSLRARGIVEPPGDFEAGVTGSVDTTVEVTFTENTAGDDADFAGAVDTTVNVALTIPLRSVADFKPDHLAARVPEIRRLVLLRRLVLELRSYISGSPMLGVALRDELEKTRAELKELQAKAAAGEAVPEDQRPGRPSAQTKLAQLKAALAERHPQLLVEPPPTPPPTPDAVSPT